MPTPVTMPSTRAADGANLSGVDAIELRLRGRACERGPAAIADFVGRSPLVGRDPGEPIAVAGDRRELASADPIVVFFQPATFGIPPIGEVALDLGSWHVRPTAFGYLATVEPRRARSIAWVVAACLPLVSLPAAARAAPSERPTVQRPRTETTEPATVETPTNEAAEPVQPEPLDDAPATEPPAPSPPTPPARPRADPLWLDDPAVLDAAWAGVIGERVEIRLKGDRRLSGRVGAVQQDTFTLIRSDDGAVLVLPKSSVVSLRGHVPKPIPTRSGAGLIAGGAVLTTVGTPTFIAGVALLAICPSCTYIHLPLLLVGAGALAGGIPMVVKGAKRRDAFQRAIAEHQVTASVMPTRHGWTGGLRFRF